MGKKEVVPNRQYTEEFKAHLAHVGTVSTPLRHGDAQLLLLHQTLHNFLRDENMLLAECCVHPAVAVATVIEFEDVGDRPARSSILVRNLQASPMIEIGAAGKAELG